MYCTSNYFVIMWANEHPRKKEKKIHCTNEVAILLLNNVI